MTLRGPSGPRRGAVAMDLGIVPDGAVLICNGIVREVGPSRRVENLGPAKTAKVIDASGKIVMPGFVDPDAVLVHPSPAYKPGPNAQSDSPAEASLRTLSTKVLQGRAAATAAEWVRNGVLSVGAHSGHALELREAVKILTVHRTIQARQLRIRSIFSLRQPPGEQRDRVKLLADVVEKWLPAIRAKKLASIFEVTPDDDDSALGVDGARAAAVAASQLGFSIRVRCTGEPTPRALQLAKEAGALGVVAPLPAPGSEHRWAQSPDSLQILTAAHGFGVPPADPSAVRRMLDNGCAVALGSAYRPLGQSSMNPQFLLHGASVRFGMATEEAITAATWNSACSLRMSQSAGSIEPGKPADIVIVDAPDFHELTRRVGHNDVATVMRAGNIVYKRGAVA